MSDPEKGPSIEQEPTIEKPKKPEAKLPEYITPDFLKAIAQASGNFSVRIDQRMGPNDPMGRTDMRTRVISLNPYAVEKFPPQAVEGLLTHEAGHHAPPVEKLDRKMVADLARKNIVPDSLTPEPKLKADIIRALNAHLCNAELDVWDESFMSRRPHKMTAEAIRALYQEGGKRTSLQSLPLPEQLCQLLVGEDRYPSDIPIKDLVDLEVFKVYQKLKKSGAVETLNDRRAFENYFAKDTQLDDAVDRKLLAHKEAFLPAWLELFQKEKEKRQEQEKQQGKGQSQSKEQGQPNELTNEQIQQIIDQLAKELQQLGEQYQSQTPTEDQGSDLNKIIQDILSQERKPEASKPAKENPFDKLKKLGDKTLQEWKDKQLKGMAENQGIRIESVRTWEEIKQEKQQEIDNLAASLADVFLEDRRKRIQHLLREGEIVPGLEYEYTAAVLSGDVSPKAHMKQVQNPEFLETEIEFIQDVSGSMSGEPLRKCLELVVIICEAFRKIREDLDAEQLLDPKEEQPLRIGATKFETSAERVKKLEEPLTDEQEMKIIDELTKGGGGTDEEQALKEVYGELTLHASNILKFMVVLSDGHGNKEAVQRIMDQIEDDNQILVAAVGLGSGAKAVVEAYTSGLRKEEQERNVFGFEAEDPADMLPQLIEFLKKQVQARRQYL